MKRELSTRMKSLKTRLDLWRKQQNGVRRPLPQELWDEAVQIAKSEGVGSTAYDLRLNSSALKKRLEKETAEQANEEASATFVQVNLPQSPPDAQVGRMIIEFTKPRGERMRIDAAASSMVDVVGLAQSFWSYGT